MKSKLLILPFLSLLACGPSPGETWKNRIEEHQNNPSGDFYKNTSEKFYSPDKRCYATIVEHGLDSTEANTQVLLTFDKTGAGVYTVKGIHKNLKVSWKNNSTLVIETKKDFRSLTKWPQIQSFDDIIKVEYIEL